jgi:hypothetical protein
MESAEIVIGIVVTILIALIMVFSMYKIWKIESENPTENLTPKE